LTFSKFCVLPNATAFFCLLKSVFETWLEYGRPPFYSNGFLPPTSLYQVFFLRIVSPPIFPPPQFNLRTSRRPLHPTPRIDLFLLRHFLPNFFPSASPLFSEAPFFGATCQTHRVGRPVFSESSTIALPRLSCLQK